MPVRPAPPVPSERDVEPEGGPAEKPKAASESAPGPDTNSRDLAEDPTLSSTLESEEDAAEDNLGTCGILATEQVIGLKRVLCVKRAYFAFAMRAESSICKLSLCW
jgi:hypothetical protein